MPSALMLLACGLNLAAVVFIATAVAFLFRAARQPLDSAEFYDVRSSLRALQLMAKRLEARSRCNARAGLMIAIAFLCQGGAMILFTIARPAM